MPWTLPAVSQSTWQSRLTQQPFSWRSSARCLGLALVVWSAAVSGARADQVDDYVTAQMSKQRIPGLSLAVLKGGKPVKVKGYGVSNLELNSPATPESVYMIGSISKQFIAAGIVLLNKEGKLGLEDSIRKYLPDAPETWQPITVRHALTHTAGLVREPPGFDPVKPQSDADLIKGAYALPLASKPGEKHAYSNLGYYVLAEIIHLAAQKPWPQYLQERLFAPLGMNATRITTLAELVPHRVDGYEWAEGKYRNGGTLIGVRPSGAFLSSVQDLAKWDAALYADELFSPQQREMMWTPVKLNDGSERPYGFGWRVDKVGKHRQVHHAGTIAGFRAEMTRFVDDQLTVIVLTSLVQALPERIALGVAALYLPDLLPKRNAVKLPAEVLDAYTGQYQMPGGGVMNVTRSGGKLLLVMSMGKMSMELGFLIPESKTRFFLEDDPRATLVFSTDAQGRLQLTGEDQDGKPGQASPKLDPQKQK
ncbi:MAG: serine hydrolase [Gemmataceae bacterium]|nr:serine hydrolase [Gemmataceae bacterium]